jgi:predicted DNA-binding protein with PD1-like motif
MKQITFRLKQGQLLKEEIKKVVQKNNIQAGVLLSMAGGLENAVLRMAGSTPDNQIIKEWNKRFEIVSGTGTVSVNGCHIHLSLSDADGNVIGGHLRDGCKIMYTVEVVIGIFEGVLYKRVVDNETGFKELEIEQVFI